MATPKYQRILLKLSGEALQGEQGYGIDPQVIHRVALEIKEIRDLGVEIGVVIGGGNIFRGIAGAAVGMDRAQADYMGMVATVINSLALQDALEKVGCYTRVMSAIAMQQVSEPYIRRRAVRHMEKGRVVIFAAGTGNPFFSTDTAAALRGVELQAGALLKATKVDGVYNKDPVRHADALRYDHLAYMDILNQGLRVMDQTAVTMCMENRLPIVVFNLFEHGNIRRVVFGEPVGTVIGPESAAGSEAS